jgi:hypothetical protein
MGRYALVGSHQSMVYDDVRNDAYSKAIKKLVGPQSVVLDLGAGLGLHGLMAARCGAKKIYMVDSSPILNAAKKVVEQNGYSSQFVWLEDRIENIELPEKVDLIISVFTGNFLLEEDLLPSLIHARNRFLSPTGNMLPDHGVMVAAPVSAPGFYDGMITAWDAASSGFSFRGARSFASNRPHFARATDIEPSFLAKPEDLSTLDFTSAIKAECHCKVEFEIDQAGLCHGVLGWFELGLADTVLSTSPSAPEVHWSQAFLPLDPPLDVERGDRMSFLLDRPEFGDWTWEVSHNDSRQRKSSFLAGGLSLKQLKTQADDHFSELSDRGRAAQFVLSQLDGANSVTSISECVLRRYPQCFLGENDAKRFVKYLAASYGE